MSDILARLQTKIDADLAAIKPPPSALLFDGTNIQAIVNALAMQGIALVRDFVPQAEARALGQSIKAKLAPALARVAEEKNQDCGDYIVNFQLGQFKTFPDMVAAPKPVFNMRHGRASVAADAGFVDIFKAETLLPELNEYRVLLENGLPAQVTRQFQALKYRPTSFNLYVNDGVVSPRAFHIDADIHQIKAFLYLTDVLRLEDGPYCYIPGSHQEQQIKHINRLYNAVAGRPWTDMSLADPAAGIACLAPAGTLILSMQSGLHRGYPQTPDASRLMLVELFEPGP